MMQNENRRTIDRRGGENLNSTTYLVLLLLILIVLIQQKKRKAWIARCLKLKQGKENQIMKEAAKKFMGKSAIFICSMERLKA